jgi:hypothetical protein
MALGAQPGPCDSQWRDLPEVRLVRYLDTWFDPPSQDGDAAFGQIFRVDRHLLRQRPDLAFTFCSTMKAAAPLCNSSRCEGPYARGLRD